MLLGLLLGCWDDIKCSDDVGICWDMMMLGYTLATLAAKNIREIAPKSHA